MTDGTLDTLTGATILKATRNGIWLDLETTKGRVLLSARYARTDLHCLGCGEERLVEVVDTAGIEEAVCGVCARSWKLER
jgi:hypothetical protein